MKRKLHRIAFYIMLLIVGATVIETDVIMGHHEALRLQGAIHWVEEPRDREE